MSYFSYLIWEQKLLKYQRDLKVLIVCTFVVISSMSYLVITFTHSRYRALIFPRLFPFSYSPSLRPPSDGFLFPGTPLRISCPSQTYVSVSPHRILIVDIFLHSSRLVPCKIFCLIFYWRLTHCHPRFQPFH